VQTSCGFGKPLLTTTPDSEDLDSQKPVLLDRDTMGHWSRNRIEKDELLQWRAQYDFSSIDGCPGMRTASRDHGDIVWLALVKARMGRMFTQKDALQRNQAGRLCNTMKGQDCQGSLTSAIRAQEHNKGGAQGRLEKERGKKC